MQLSFGLGRGELTTVESNERSRATFAITIIPEMTFDHAQKTEFIYSREDSQSNSD